MKRVAGYEKGERRRAWGAGAHIEEFGSRNAECGKKDIGLRVVGCDMILDRFIEII